MSSQPDEARAKLRAEYRLRRKSLPSDYRERATSAIAKNACEILLEEPPGNIATYFATDGELDPAPVKQVLEPLGWRFHLPVIGPDRSMTFQAWDNSAQLRPNRYGIPEPAHQSVAEPAQMDVVLVPGVAFDPTGSRLGMGGGYYDRALSGTDEGPPWLIALAFDIQMLPTLQQERWDVAVDAIVTETQVVQLRTKVR